MPANCYFCESTDDIEEHHILPQRFDGRDQPTNVVDVCHDCHWKLERLYNKDFWEAIGVDDPRATKESHVLCSIHGCMEHSVGRFGVEKGALAPRCEQQKPITDDKPDPSELPEIKKRAFGGVEKTTRTGAPKYD
jgi:hypothetical protein